MRPLRFENNAMNRKMRCVFLALLFGSFGLCAFAPAQTLNADRAYEHVSVAPLNLAEFSNDIAPIAQLHLFAYRAGVWQEIPFQIDERGMEITVDGDTVDNSYFPNAKDGLLDDSDDFLFMAQDAGERAPVNDWVAEASARSFPRYELKVTDPRTQQEGYVYLYRSATLPVDPQVPTYVRYAAGPAANPAADTVKGISYVQGHTANGIPDYLAVPAAFGGTGADFLDRLKLRIRAVPPIFGEQIVNERDNLVAVANGVRTVQGRIRVIREVRERLQIFLFGTPIPIDTLGISLFFYPYSAQLSGEINLTSTLSARLLRASFDFDPNVANQGWSNQNADRIITGASGALTPAEAQVVLLPQRNWFNMSSIHGSLVGIFGMGSIANTAQQFYFHDAQSGTADGTPDTGDNHSYGDTGFMITSGSAIVARFQLGMSAFYLKPGLTRAEAAALSTNAEAPMQTAANAQTFDGVPPTRVNDLRVCFTTDTSAVLFLTAPSDVGSFVKSYEVGYSTTPVGNDTAAWFDTIAQKTTNLPAPAQPGTYQLVTVYGVTLGERYCFILRSFDDYGNASALSNVACGTIVAVAEPEIAEHAPARFMLAQSYPNPLHAAQSNTLIRYELLQTQPVPVALRVYDLLGHEVRHLVKAKQGRGSYAVRWDGRDESGALVTAGVYFYELRAGDLRQVKKLVVTR